MLSRFHVGTLGEVARLVGVELQTVKEWRSGPNAMPGSEGRWDIVEIFRWRCDRLKANGSNADKSAEMKELELRDLQAIVEKRELQARESRKELLPKDAVKSLSMAVCSVFRNATDTIQREFGPEAYKVLSLACDEAERQVRDVCARTPE